jgi:transcriptional regulator with XRE-family HTH domain
MLQLMTDVMVGLVFRAIRRRRGWRQIDVAQRAGVSQQVVSLIEHGRLEQVSLGALRSIARALEIELPLAPRWRGPELDRLLDAEHAAMVEATVAALDTSRWVVTLEWSFNHFGERGAVDVLAWNESRRALAVIEVKSRVVDVQDLLGKLDRKVRLARELLPHERVWAPEVVGRILVLPDTSTARDAIARMGRTFDVSLPARTIDTRRWLGDPREDLRSIWFLRLTRPVGGVRRSRQPRDPAPGHGRMAPPHPSRVTTPARDIPHRNVGAPTSLVSRRNEPSRDR